MRNRFHCLLCSAAVLLALLATGPVAQAQSAADAMWTDVDQSTLRTTTKRHIVPQHYRTLALDKQALGRVLDEAPLESRAGVKGGEAVLHLPLPDGGFGRFRIVESPIMEPGLAAKFPEIKTYRGQGIEDPTAIVRFDTTPAGFHAMILSSSGDIYIDPYSRDNTDHYMSYLARDYKKSGPAFECGVRGHSPIQASAKALSAAKALSGTNLRTYRLAVAATGEYTSFHGGTVAQGQAAIVTAMNRVNGIYERDVAIRMVLIANNDQLVYTNGSTDPYNNNNAGTLINQNQSNIDSVIGSANYDIGHVVQHGRRRCRRASAWSLRSPRRQGARA